MMHAGEIGAESGAAEVIELGRKRAIGGCHNGGLERTQDALTIWMPEWNEPRPGRDPIGANGRKKCAHRGRECDVVTSARDASCDRISQWAVRRLPQLVECY